MLTLNTEDNGKLEVITIDHITGEGTDNIRLEIESKYCSAWIDLNEEEAKQLRDRLDE